PERPAPLETGTAGTRGQSVRGQRTEPSDREPDCRSGAEGGPPGLGDRFFGTMLAACRTAAEAASVDYPRLVYPYVDKEVSLATPIPLDRLCELAKISRPGFYRWRNAPPAVDADMDLRDEIERIALEVNCYGWLRVRAEPR